MGWYCHGLGWSGLGVVGMILNLVFFAGVLAVLGFGVFWLARQPDRRTTPGVEVDPLEIARRRLAAGEISGAEFEEIRDRLRS